MSGTRVVSGTSVSSVDGVDVTAGPVGKKVSTEGVVCSGSLTGLSVGTGIDVDELTGGIVITVLDEEQELSKPNNRYAAKTRVIILFFIFNFLYPYYLSRHLPSAVKLYHTPPIYLDSVHIIPLPFADPFR